MAIQTVFCVTGVDTDLSLKRIIVETNFDIDPNTVGPDNIKLYCVNKDHMELIIPTRLETKYANVIVHLEDYPKPSDKYYLVVKNLKDIMNRELHNVFDKYIYFDYDITSKVEMILPTDNFVSKTEDVEIKIAISDEDDETKYRFEISSDIAFFNKASLVFRDNNHEMHNSNKEEFKIVGANKDGLNLNLLVKFLNNGQYFIRARAEKTHYIVGDWCTPISIQVVTTTPLKDETGYLDDFLLPNEIFREEFIPLEVVSKTPDATTNQDFYIEFNKNIEFVQDLDSKYSKDGLLYIGKGYFIRRDL